MKRLALTLVALLLAAPAQADTLVDNVNGITLDKDGKVVRFTGMVIGTDGKVKPALDDLDQVLDTLNRQDRQLQALLDGLAPSVRYLANATGSGPYVPLYIKPPALPGDDSICKSEGRC